MRNVQNGSSCILQFQFSIDSYSTSKAMLPTITNRSVIKFIGEAQSIKRKGESCLILRFFCCLFSASTPRNQLVMSFKLRSPSVILEERPLLSFSCVTIKGREFGHSLKPSQKRQHPWHRSQLSRKNLNIGSDFFVFGQFKLSSLKI